MNKAAKVCTLVALALILLAATATAGGLYGRFEQTNAARRSNKAVWHAVICSIEQSVLKNKTLTVEKKQDALAFYDGLLVNEVVTRPCGYTVLLPRR